MTEELPAKGARVEAPAADAAEPSMMAPASRIGSAPDANSVSAGRGTADHPEAAPGARDAHGTLGRLSQSAAEAGQNHRISAIDGASPAATTSKAREAEGAAARDGLVRGGQAGAAKDIAVATGRSPAPQGERHLPGPRVITGEVMPPRRSRRRLVLVMLLFAALAAGAYYGFGWWTVGRFIVSTDDAYVAADMSVLAAKVPGLVSAVHVADNQPVRAGTILVSIDDGDYRLAVDAAANRLATQDATIARIAKQVDAQRAAIAQARAQLASAEAELVRAQAAFDRAQKLAATAFGTKATLDQARADRDKAVAGITAARSGLDQANAMLDVLKAQKLEAIRSRAELATALDRAKRDLEFTKIRAPFDGVVGNRGVEAGQYVQAGTRVMALVPLDTVRVEANLKETQLAAVKPGQPVEVRVDAFGGLVVTGTVESLSPASGSLFSLLPPENATGNFTKIVQRLTVRVALPANIIRQSILRPGMSVVVGINTREPGSYVPGEDLPKRIALLFESAKGALRRLLNTGAAAEPNGSATRSAPPVPSGQAAQPASTQ